ncbi:NAD(P)H-dependent oxidoreductase [Microbulbifer rhizosphaerae]|uniref:Putative NADPH-quinone reductase n=1 Tax=Microbulbifer rhizosphaerae TaxID=1562603 RepID=A0A7W4WCX6_9GAMM|nr:NAD(P)H-dependent oxidoreductase [Microbulbifer rhizosphaerae]MBB3061935.1 putative NADPH-quinone reductase [Microbulbifer rhizosphaerae]
MNVLIINANPKRDSFCHSLASAYASGCAVRGYRVERIDLGELNFDPVLREGYGGQPLEPDMERLQSSIQWADHLAFVYPNWWGVMPALLKGALDRAMTPGFAFRFDNGAVESLLNNKSASLLITMDVPIWLHRFVHRSRGTKLMRDNVLKFCGIRARQTCYFGPLHNSCAEKRKRWLDKAHRLGRAA